MTTRTPGSVSREGGFALALVVLLLFAIGVAAATGYQVVRTEARLALQTHEGVQALAIARAGLELFVAEEVGQPRDTVVYPLNGGEAVVTARKVYDLTVPDELYVLTSVGTYADPRGQTAPATRTVRQYAVRRATPMNRDVLAGLIALSGNVNVESGAVVDGDDSSSGVSQQDCSGVRDQDRDDSRGIIYVDNVTVNGDVDGEPTPTYEYLDSAALATALDLPWEMLKDPSFPAGQFDDTWPNFGALPADSFPLVRVNGDLAVQNTESGRGLLIVTGTFEPSRNFSWDGIILAGDFRGPTGPPGQRRFNINGILAVGLSGGTNQIQIRSPSEILYHFCWVLEAGRALAHLEPLDGTWSEGM